MLHMLHVHTSLTQRCFNVCFCRSAQVLRGTFRRLCTFEPRLIGASISLLWDAAKEQLIDVAVRRGSVVAATERPEPHWDTPEGKQTGTGASANVAERGHRLRPTLINPLLCSHDSLPRTGSVQRYQSQSSRDVTGPPREVLKITSAARVGTGELVP